MIDKRDFEAQIALAQAVFESQKRKGILAQRDSEMKLRKIFSAENARRAARPEVDDEPVAYSVMRKMKVCENIADFFVELNRRLNQGPSIAIAMSQNTEVETLEQAKQIFRLREILKQKLSQSARNEIEVRLQKLEFALRLVVQIGHMNLERFTWPTGWQVRFHRAGRLEITSPQT